MSAPGAGVRRRFLADLAFAPDPFQSDALDALDAGSSVLVSAPTGSGKTLVAAYAVHQALDGGAKAFYTTPLKALSNQKFGEFCAAHGEGRVGLLTGDVAIRPEAPVVVMTTEVLRNMLLSHSPLLRGLGVVVLDEVHFLQDPYRGGVWEEVLILAPPEVVFVCLSATVANAAELGAWLRSVRGPVEVVVERRRPITLRHHFAVHRRSNDATELLPLLEGSRPSAEGLRLDQTGRRALTTRQPRWRTGRGGGGGGGGPGGPRLPFRGPRRTEVIELLDDHELLPAIVFIFSRAACDDAVRQCLRDGLRLTDRADRTAIRAVAEAHVASLADDDLDVLAYGEWLEGLESGIASHHAGLVPAFREAVESCFAAGLLRVVFATETLSLGINMPARSVVIERFTKFGAAGRAALTSGEYAQLTGRAGRRGLDREGHAVVLWSSETAFADVARVATAPPPDLRSAFRPTYNLAVNLVRRFDRPQALEVLRQSFAQWQAAVAAASRGAKERGGAGGGAGGGGGAGAGGGAGGAGGLNLGELLGRRLAVLEERSYVDGWRLTDQGLCLSRLYHECDLLVAEVLAAGVLEGAEPSVVAGVLCALVFEPRRAQRSSPTGRREHQNRAAPRRGGRGKPAGDRLGERRRSDLAERLVRVVELAERLRTIEEVHRVPRTRAPDGGASRAVAAWARGAPFGLALELAAADVGVLAPGDFVRTVKQVADLAEQVSVAVAGAPEGARGDDAVGPAAAEAARLLVRDVVATGGATGGATASNIAAGTPT